jgi:hypothetical protein
MGKYEHLFCLIFLFYFKIGAHIFSHYSIIPLLLSYFRATLIIERVYRYRFHRFYTTDFCLLNKTLKITFFIFHLQLPESPVFSTHYKVSIIKNNFCHINPLLILENRITREIYTAFLAIFQRSRHRHRPAPLPTPGAGTSTVTVTSTGTDRHRPALTGTDQHVPAPNGTDRHKPARTGTDRHRTGTDRHRVGTT